MERSRGASRRRSPAGGGGGVNRRERREERRQHGGGCEASRLFYRERSRARARGAARESPASATQFPCNRHRSERLNGSAEGCQRGRSHERRSSWCCSSTCCRSTGRWSPPSRAAGGRRSSRRRRRQWRRGAARRGAGAGGGEAIRFRGRATTPTASVHRERSRRAPTPRHRGIRNAWRRRAA